MAILGYIFIAILVITSICGFIAILLMPFAYYAKDPEPPKNINITVTIEKFEEDKKSDN